MVESNRRTLLVGETPQTAGKELSPAWCEFMRFCAELKFGEIERLSIQDGIPVLAEITKKKVRFRGPPRRGAEV